MSSPNRKPVPTMSTALKGAQIYFGPFLVTSQVLTSFYTPSPLPKLPHLPRTDRFPPPQVFHLTPLSFALVNLKPILPGHVLVSPRRRVPRVSDLTAAETSDLFATVQRVGRVVERVYGGSSLNIAIQDGPEAGQSVAHVHAHIIPRKRADLDHRGGTDAVYGMLDGEEGDLRRAFAEEKERGTKFPAVDNEARAPRSMEEMEAEAEMLAREMEKEGELR
ncbi:HIT family protein [Aspergillus clavatus NRRL 1]|uniref:Bis(5'-adenosyl)-triphosphatase n=1 Tax=Aspergillus clavatus (strain ATCC 1007 / CBS 513.65 / DSM 816 / NCTC 3887 / NRRL 1 / QM 1276 / 107) TaxID=344612 RepID=A1C6L1_ASPCL|nr:HIT domain protein [Aspergillus clavatus NRRL 1]EAW14032.1 HIT domain protein [Aspergillus clavatus NRRL 1]